MSAECAIRTHHCQIKHVNVIWLLNNRNIIEEVTRSCRFFVVFYITQISYPGWSFITLQCNHSNWVLQGLLSMMTNCTPRGKKQQKSLFFFQSYCQHISQTSTEPQAHQHVLFGSFKFLNFCMTCVFLFLWEANLWLNGRLICIQASAKRCMLMIDNVSSMQNILCQGSKHIVAI